MAPAYVHASPPAFAADPTLTLTAHADDVSRSATLVVVGELDLASADQLAAALEGQINRGRRYVRIDMSELTFLDATALGVLAAAHHDLLARRGTLTISGANASVSRLLRITGLDSVLFTTGPAAHPPRHAVSPAALRPVAV